MSLIDGLSGILGGSAGKEEMEKATGLSRENIEMLKKLNVPTVEEQRILLQNPELAGLLNAETVDSNAYDNVSMDPRLQQAQMRALEQLGGLSEQGLGAEDRSAFNQIRRQAAAESQAAQQSTLQNAAARGTLNSGNTLTAQLMAGQNSANQMAQQGDNIAAQAAAARRQALGQYGNMAQNMSAQDLALQGNKANSGNTIAQFNAQSKTGANQFNLNNQQNIANTTASNANQQEIYNKQLKQQQFQNELSKATGVSGANNNLANQYTAQGTAAAQGQAAMTGALVGGAAKIASSGMA